MENQCFKKEGSHLYELHMDDFGRQSWIHVYQNARYSKDTKRNFNFLVDEYLDLLDHHVNW